MVNTISDIIMSCFTQISINCANTTEKLPESAKSCRELILNTNAIQLQPLN